MIPQDLIYIVARSNLCGEGRAIQWLVRSAAKVLGKTLQADACFYPFNDIHVQRAQGAWNGSRNRTRFFFGLKDRCDLWAERGQDLICWARVLNVERWHYTQRGRSKGTTEGLSVSKGLGRGRRASRKRTRARETTAWRSWRGWYKGWRDHDGGG